MLASTNALASAVRPPRSSGRQLRRRRRVARDALPESCEPLHDLLVCGQPDLFDTASDALLRKLASERATADSALPSSYLGGRVAALCQREARHAQVAALLRLQVFARFRRLGIANHLSLPELSDAPLPGRASLESLPAALDYHVGCTELAAYATAMLPGSNDAAVCRLDALSGGRLCCGAAQFAYFVHAVLELQPGSTDAASLRRLSRTTKSDQVWAAVKSIVADQWGLSAAAAEGLDRRARGPNITLHFRTFPLIFP